MSADNDFDLRPYVDVLLIRWWLVLGAAVLAGVLATGLSYLLPPTYEAEALVLVSNPAQLIQLDPRITSVAENQPVRALPELAGGDAIMSALKLELSAVAPQPGSLPELRDDLSVVAGNDPSLLRLSATHRDAAMAARIANTWATVFVRQTNEILGVQGTGQLGFYETQLAVARADQARAEEALVAFQAENRAAVIEARLEAQTLTLAEALADQRRLRRLMRDIAGLETQLGLQSNTASLPADQMAALLLQVQAYQGATTGAGSASLQLEIGEAAIDAAIDRPTLLAGLAALKAAVQGLVDQAALESETIEPQILALQAELQQLTLAEARLAQTREVAAETVTALARKVEEERITSQDVTQGLRLASPAAVPEEPRSPVPLLNGALALIVTLIAIPVVILARHWHGTR